MKDFSLVHELTLVREIMTTIERYNCDHGITASPGVIRDTLLVVAGLLHREAVSLEDHEGDPRQLQETFAEVAGARIEQVLEASSGKGRYSQQ
jgi:hypothetical protein